MERRILLFCMICMFIIAGCTSSPSSLVDKSDYAIDCGYTDGDTNKPESREAGICFAQAEKDCDSAYMEQYNPYQKTKYIHVLEKLDGNICIRKIYNPKGLERYTCKKIGTGETISCPQKFDTSAGESYYK